ncbi:hypothetical protein, partial [Pseudomonas agarici]|uniref:hypothetical protein n=3 Tax=Pseudomonas agarici TaxID=46677 RepID=UPI001C432F9B
RRKASFMLLGSGLGLTSVVLELSEAIAKQHSAAVSIKLKIAAGSLGVAGLAVDTMFSFITTRSKFQKNDIDAAVAYGIQTAAFAGAGVASGFAVALLAKKTTMVGIGLSWTGWALILVALGMTAGYVAALLQDTPTEEWAARSIWGRANDRWNSIKREQEELNKILLGLSVEFDYSHNLIDNLSASATTADNPFVLEAPDKSYVKEARLRLLIPAILKDKLQWSAEVYLYHTNGAKELIYSTGNTAQSSAIKPYIAGVASPEITQHSPDLTVITIKAEMLKYPSSSATFNLYDDVTDGQLLVNETFWVR